MNKLIGIVLLALASILVAWSILSAVGLVTSFTSADSAYGAGYLIGKTLAIILFGFIGFRAFKAGRNRLARQHGE